MERGKVLEIAKSVQAELKWKRLLPHLDLDALRVSWQSVCRTGSLHGALGYHLSVRNVNTARPTDKLRWSAVMPSKTKK